MQRRGVSLIELLIVVVVVAVLMSAGISSYGGMPHSARARTCQMNLSGLDTAMAMLETQNTALLHSDTGVIRFDAVGRILDVTGPLAATVARWNPPLVPGGRGVLDLIRDRRMFRCPEALRDEDHAPEPRDPTRNEYSWIRSPRPTDLLHGGKQGAFCVGFRLPVRRDHEIQQHCRCYAQCLGTRESGWMARFVELIGGG
jgi:prepilin-type N-terminal cleavage/methylation domain-containing protein